METTPQKQWRFDNWGTLGWLESAIKLVAFTIAILAGIRAIGSGSLVLPAGEQLAQFIIMAILALGLLVAIYDRILEREIFAMGFVLLNNLAHWGMVLALASTINAPVIPFAGLVALGDLVKVYFLYTSDFQVRDTPKAVMIALTLMYVVAYVVLLLIALL